MSEKTKSILLTFADLRAEYRLPRSTVYHLIASAGFPRQIKLSSKSAYFKREAVDAWIAEREAITNNIALRSPTQEVSYA